MSDKITALTNNNFETVLTADKPVVIDFYADWCGPCKMMTPVFDELSEKYDGKISFCKLNIDEEKKLAIANKVMSIPTFLFIKNGREIERFTGALNIHDLEAKIQNLL